jgi:hypothetical protein
VKDSLLAGEQVVAPVDRGPQRLLAGQRGAAASAEHVEAVAEAHSDLVERQRGRAGRGELDGQRHAVQTPADLLHGAGGAIRGHRSPAAPRRRARRTAARLGQRGHPPDDLVGAAQRLAARGQDAHAGPGAQNLLGQAGARVDQVLAVVEHDQRLARGQMRHQRLQAERDAGIGTPTASAAACATSAGSLRLARSTNQAPSGSCASRVGRGLERQPRLAAAPGAGERHEPGVPSRRAMSARSRSRPTNEVSWRGRLPPPAAAAPASAPAAAGRARGRGVRIGRQLGAEALAQKLVLGQRLLATAGARVQAHERAVSRLRERVGDQRALQSGPRRPARRRATRRARGTTPCAAR